MKGSAEAALYEKGVNLYGKAGLVRGVLQIIFSALYPKLLDSGLQPGRVLAVAFALFSAILLAFANTNTPRIAEFVIIIMAFPAASLFSMPVGMTVELSDETNRGRYLGALNCFAVIPQLIDTTYVCVISFLSSTAIFILLTCGSSIVLTPYWRCAFTGILDL